MALAKNGFMDSFHGATGFGKKTIPSIPVYRPREARIPALLINGRELSSLRGPVALGSTSPQS